MGSNLIHPFFKVEYLTPNMKEAYTTSTLQTQQALMWEGMIKYKIILETPTICLNWVGTFTLTNHGIILPCQQPQEPNQNERPSASPSNSQNL